MQITEGRKRERAQFGQSDVEDEEGKTLEEEQMAFYSSEMCQLYSADFIDFNSYACE